MLISIKASWRMTARDRLGMIRIKEPILLNRNFLHVRFKTHLPARFSRSGRGTLVNRPLLRDRLLGRDPATRRGAVLAGPLDRLSYHCRFRCAGRIVYCPEEALVRACRRGRPQRTDDGRGRHDLHRCDGGLLRPPCDRRAAYPGADRGGGFPGSIPDRFYAGWLGHEPGRNRGHAGHPGQRAAKSRPADIPHSHPGVAMKLVYYLLSVLAPALILAACSPAQPTAQPQPTDQPAASSPEQSSDGTRLQLPERIDEQGQVPILVKPQPWEANSETLNFEVTLDTHSVDLSYDLAALSTLATDAGFTIQAVKWDAPSGGHHVSGMLSFPAGVDGKSVLDGASKLTLTIQNIDSPERTFSWDISS